MTKKILAAALAIAFAASIASPALANPNTASFRAGETIPDTSGFSGVPGVSDGGPDLQRSRFTYQLEPGQHINDFFYVSNVGTTDLNLNVYAADGTTTIDGSFDVSNSQTPPSAVGSWVKFNNGKPVIQVALKAGRQASIPFTLTAPSNASPGDHVGGMVVATEPSGAGQIKIERRVVTRLYARVKGELVPNLSVSDMRATYMPAFNPFDGTVTESFTIVNQGNVSLKAVAFADVTGIFGIPLATQAVAPVTEILPGTTREYTISIPAVGQWVFLSPKIKLVPDVDKDALNPGALVTISRETSLWVFPTTWVIIFVILAIIYFVIRTRIKNRQRQVKQWLAYAEAEAKRKANNG